jgi:hypothetical protein
MSEAISGNTDDAAPGCRSAHPGYAVSHQAVIPGRCAASNYDVQWHIGESRANNFWIPGLRLMAHPGMTT